jgi:hypothetical protein
VRNGDLARTHLKRDGDRKAKRTSEGFALAEGLSHRNCGRFAEAPHGCDWYSQRETGVSALTGGRHGKRKSDDVAIGRERRRGKALER